MWGVCGGYVGGMWGVCGGYVGGMWGVYGGHVGRTRGLCGGTKGVYGGYKGGIGPTARASTCSFLSSPDTDMSMRPEPSLPYVRV